MKTMTKTHFIAIAEMMAKSIRTADGRFEPLCNTAQEWAKLGSKKNARRVYREAWNLPGIDPGLKNSFRKDALEAGIRMPMTPEAPKKKRAISDEDKLYVSMYMPGTIGIRRYLFLLRWLKKDARKVHVNPGSLHFFLRHGEKHIRQLLAALRPWKADYISTVDDLTTHYCEKGQYEKALGYLRLMPSRDEQLGSLLYRFLTLDPQKVDDKFKIILEYVKQELNIKIREAT